MLEKTDLGHSIFLFSIRPNCHAPVRNDWINNLPQSQYIYLWNKQYQVPCLWIPWDSMKVLQLGGGDDVVATDTSALACWDQGPTREVILVFTGMQETENWWGFESLQAM